MWSGVGVAHLRDHQPEHDEERQQHERILRHELAWHSLDSNGNIHPCLANKEEASGVNEDTSDVNEEASEGNEEASEAKRESLGNCKCTTFLTCGKNTHCRSDPKNPCRGECMCDKEGINECTCVPKGTSNTGNVLDHQKDIEKALHLVNIWSK